jgi:phosphatidylserine decarboxylase
MSPAAPRQLARGAELGRFNLGSTAILLFPRGTIEWSAGLAPGDAVRMGQALGRKRPQ